MAKYEFLKASWGLELRPEAQAKVEREAESTAKRDVEQYLKDTDVRNKFGVISGLPKEISRLDIIPEGKYFVQLVKIIDATQPAKFCEDFDGGKWRMLAVEMSDGEQKMKGVEYQNHKALGVHLPPGTKLLLWSTKDYPLRVQNGHLLLTPNTVEVLGGEVESLMASWQASREVEANRLLWATEGIKKNDKLDPAPKWVDFDPRKARGNAHDKQGMAEERASWAKAQNFTGTASGLGSKDNKTWDDDGQARFEKKDFAEQGEKLGRMAANTFAQAQKGGKGKGKGDKGGKGEGKRGRRGGDDEYGGEEKRAPIAINSLAAFIKPTKKGELADEAVALLLEGPSSSKPAAGDAKWSGQEEWGASSWGASGDSWGASGDSWSGASWSGGGGGGGHRKGGHSSKGGGGGGSGKGGKGSKSSKGNRQGSGGWSGGGW